jgi:C-terminal processing protease CtpA/Prc
MDLDQSDEELPSLETLFPTATESDPSVQRFPRRRSIPPVKQVAAAKPIRRQRSPDFSLTWLEKQREELDKRDAARARTQAMLNESIEDFDDPHADRMEQDTENALGKEFSEKLKAVLSRIGGDIGQVGRYRLFRHARKERKFDIAWIRGVEWLEGFEGSICVLG